MLDAELLYDRNQVKSTDFKLKPEEKLTDKSFKGIDISLLGFQHDGIIENEIGEDNQANDDLYSTYGRCK